MDQDSTLAVAHLNKLFADIKTNAPSIGSSQHVNEIHEQKIYNILPLFCKIFNNQNNGNNGSPSSVNPALLEKFSDPTSFTQMVSRLMVTEIRRRASNKTTEKASIAIVEFLEISPTVNTPTDKKGWILLSTLNILVSFNSPQLISIMTSNSLASTLVKCLYLFFDLPPFNNEEDELPVDEQSSEYLSNAERRQLLQKVFSQLLTRLCASPTSLNDLTKKDDLILLFNVITSWCPEHNSMWRKTAADAIITMAKHGNINVEYLHSKNCVNLFMENVQRIVELGTADHQEIILMMRTFIFFLTEYVNNSVNNGSMISVLLDDFSECFGYQFFVDFALKLEQTGDVEALKEFLSLIHYFAKVGGTPLKPRPLSVNQVFIIENFTIPKPSRNSVKNLKAFDILISLWNKTVQESSQLLILNTIMEIYREDRANYFLLESQSTLSSFAERLEEKSEQIQTNYYSLLEYIVRELNYVPCKELITVGMILKRQNSSQSQMLALRMLNNLLKMNAIFKDVYREVGLVDILCSTYIHQVQTLETSMKNGGPTESELAVLSELIELFINIMTGPMNNNCQIFHESEASKHTFQLLTMNTANSSKTISAMLKQIRRRVFAIIQQLILSNNSEDNLSQLLVLLHKDKSAFGSVQEMLSLKLSVLKSLLVVLSENHRVRALFRKIGGFVSVISVIVYLENYLCEIPSPLVPDSKQVWNLLRCVFATLTTAMRFEPANSKYFAQEICSPSFTDSLRLLGCFNENMFAWKKTEQVQEPSAYELLFSCPFDELLQKMKLDRNECACILMRLLYEMALDVLDRKPTIPSGGGVNDEKTLINRSPMIIIYPCIIDSMFQLLKFIGSSRLCVFLMEKICEPLSLERNIQAMCETGLVTELMNSAYVEVLIEESNVLHNLVRYIFERLAAHHIQAKDLRTFLRLSNPLNSIPLDEIKPKIFHRDRSIPLSRIKSLISVSTPKDASETGCLLSPPFTEFDLSQEGFSCIFIPSIAPVSVVGYSNGPSSILTGAIVGNSDVPVTVNGGIGTGERAFPSQSGLSFTTWIYIHKSDPSESHTINVLTIYRATQPNQEYSCLKIYLNLPDRSMFISTQELPIFSNIHSTNMSLDSDHNVRFPVPELTEENWHHIVVVLNRALLKNSTVSVYINGIQKLSRKLSYISSIVGGSSGIANTSSLYINGFIGTPPQYRKNSRLIWKQGPCHLIEESLSHFFVLYIYMLGPNYIGSFQAINYRPSGGQTSIVGSSGQFQFPTQNQSHQQQIVEDKLIFGLNARATSVMTLSKMRRVYLKFDCKQIAKIIGLSTHENATPIYVLHNSSGHLCGPSRPLGGILIGNIGARCFVPKQITLTFSDIGGSFILLGLIANSQNMETLYASVKALVCIIRVNRELQLEMERINGYQILSVFLRRKRIYLNSHTLHLLFDLISNLDSKLLANSSRYMYVPANMNPDYPVNFRAFKELLVDSMDIWFQIDLMKTLLEHLNEILNESVSGNENQQRKTSASEKKSLNLLHLREMNLLQRLLSFFIENDIKDDKLVHSIIVICFRLLNQTSRSKDVLYFGQFITSLSLMIGSGSQQQRKRTESVVQLENSFLKVILQLMSRNAQPVNAAVQDDMARILGFDWFLLFLNSNLNHETVTIGLVNLMILLSNNNLYSKFKEGSMNGHWLKDADSFIENRTGFQLLGFNILTTESDVGREENHSSSSSGGTRNNKNPTKVRKELFTLPGFQHLNWLLSYHIYQPKVYLIIFQAILGLFRSLTPQTLENVDAFDELQLDNFISKLPVSHKNFKQEKIHCRDLILSVISMIHDIFCSADHQNPKYHEYPKELINFIKYLYNHNRDFRFYCQNSLEFLHALCDTLVFDTNKRIDSPMVDHPATKSILEFILAIFINIINTNQCSVSVNSTSNTFFSNHKPSAILNSILNRLSNCKKAQTEIMSLFMDCITVSQEFNQSSNSHQVMNETAPAASIILNFNHSFSNIVLLMSVVVDRLWQNCYVDDRKKVLECLVHILKTNPPDSKVNSNFKSLKNLTSQVSEYNLLYKCISRCILYLVSRNAESMPDRILLFESLQFIYTHRQLLIDSKCNNDGEFFVCLTYCLLQLVDEENISHSGTKDRTTWYIVENKSLDNTDEGTLLITSVARKVWEEIFIAKKSLLEETLKVSLSLNDSGFGVESSMPDISKFRDVLYEGSLKYWSNYIESENQRLKRKPVSLSFDMSMSNSNILTEKLTNINKLNNLVTKSAGGLMSKIVGGTSGVVGSAISSAVGTTRKEVFRSSSDAAERVSISYWNLMSKKDVLYWTSVHELIVKNYINFQLKQKKILDYNLRKYIFNEWLNNEYEYLTRERAIWGPLYGSKRFDKWMLDMTEGPNRMRKKMIRNDQFYINYPYRPEMENSKKIKSPISLDSKDYYKRVHSEKYFLLDKDEDLQSFEYEMDELYAPISDSDEPSKSRSKSSSNYEDIGNDPELQDPGSDSLEIFDTGDSGIDSDKSGSSGQGPGKSKDHEDNEMQTILRLLEEGEKISHMFRVARVQGLDSYEGLLLFGKENFYLIDGFTLLKTKEIRDIDSLPPGVYDSIIPNTSSSSVSIMTSKKLCNKFAYEDIREVHKRRYLLQPIALEVFSMDGRNSLMVFPRHLRNKVYARFMSVAIHITDNAQDSLMGQKRNVNVETGGLLSNLIGETSVTQRWVRGEISNFQYLMNLNTLAGRSYNDLMQYPVFPWILADYSSNELDLSNPSTFRDLSKPLGAQTPERLEQFKKRFNEWDADTNIKVGDELIQGPYHYGTFYSSAMIVASYLVRIEPFTQHFLRLQGGHFDLADRMFHSVGDAWLSASRNNMADLKELIPEFFYLPEFLLNSNRYDFGCKQSGTRLNDVVLPPWAKDDPREFIRVHRAALECDYVSAHLHEWIDLIFGYKQNGPAAVEAVNVFHHLFYEGNADIYNIDDPLKKNATIGFINNFGQVPMQLFKKPHPMKKAFSGNSAGNLIASLSPILSSVTLTGSNASSKIFIHNLEYLKPLMHPIKELKGAVGQIVQQDKTILAVEQNKVLIPPLYNRCVAWGFADHSFRIGLYESDRALYVWESELFPPNGEILCTTVPNSRMIITAGTNSVIYVWRIKAKSFTLMLHQKLYGHTEAVTCLASSSAYGIVVSGSRDKTCIIWDLNRLVFIRQLGGGADPMHKSPIAATAINDLTGDIATCCSTMLYLWSINGDLIAYVNTLEISPNVPISGGSQNSSQILCIAFSTYNEWDPDNVILTGSSDGVVKMWTLRYQQEPLEIECTKESCSSSSSSTCSVSEDIGKTSVALNPSKDEIVRRLSIVSIKNEENEDSNTDNSSTPVDENQDNDEWNLVSQDGLGSSPLISHSESFNESRKFQEKMTDKKPTSAKIGVETLMIPGSGASIRNSKSDTALADSLNSKQRGKTDEDNCLKKGHRWSHRLVFSSKLTMHTAYERKDNREPAAITCIAVSKDHRNVFVGDARGRIFCWSVNESKSIADHWVKDDVSINCTACAVKFSITERKHHCRNCGKVFCARCSRFEIPIARLKLMKPVRVCQNCYQQLQQQQQPS